MTMFVAGAQTLDLTRAVLAYREQGFARVGLVFDESELALLRQRADDIMLGRVTVPDLFFQHDADSGRYEDLPYGQGYVGPSLGYRKIEKLENDLLFRAVIENEIFARIARQVIDGDIVIYRAVLFTKPASGGSPLPWHQDGGQFWGVDRAPLLQIWTALDDAPLGGGCVEVFAGSHRAGLVTPVGGVVPREFVASRGADEHAQPLPARAGEVLLIHNHLWHRSGRTERQVPRRAFTVCYMTAETRCLRKKRAPRQFTRVFTQVPR